MKHSKLLSVFFAAILLTGCGSTDPDKPIPSAKLSLSGDLTAHFTAQNVQTAEPDAAFRSAHTTFALGLLQRTAAQSSGSNLLISPYSVMQALGMTANGACGETLSGMEQAMGGTPVGRLNAYLAAWRSNQPHTASCMLTTANSIWIRDEKERISVKSDFLQTNTDYYAAGAYLRDFNDPRTLTDINRWIDSKTMHMIPEMLGGISPDSVMYLINAVAFDAKWETEYKAPEIRDCIFYAADGTEQTADMMYSDEHILLRDSNAVGFMRPYHGGRYYFAALLPDEGIPAAEYIAGMTPERLSRIFADADSKSVRAGLPKFTFDYDTELTGVLSDMGMQQACSPAADFSAMADSEAPIYISRVLHSTHIALNEKGTKAAAATVVEMKDAAAPETLEPVSVILDRPFVFAIYDSEAGLPVFLGLLNSLPESE